MVDRESMVQRCRTCLLGRKSLAGHDAGGSSCERCDLRLLLSSWPKSKKQQGTADDYLFPWTAVHNATRMTQSFGLCGR